MVQTSFEIGTFRFAVRTNSHAFDAWLRRTLVAYTLDEELDEAPYYSVLVGDPGEGRRPFHILYRGTTTVVRSHDLGSVADVLLADLEYPLLLQRDDLVVLEASMLRHDGVTGLVSGSLINRLGKVGPRVRRSGIQLPVPTSWCALDHDGLLTPVERRLVIPADSRADLAEVAELEPSDERFDVTEPVPARFVATTSPVLEEGFAAQAQRGAMLRELAGLVLNLHVVGGIAVEVVARMLEHSTCFEYAYSRGSRATLDTLVDVVSASR